ncbi:unnamed protein product [Orchesella dallaii]|uniref:Glycosyltransferase family 92 protein n=1 Tax=Orchesella dallaii TaxID=48710 RepID=A0ABP1QLG1_9HEXA
MSISLNGTGGGSTMFRFVARPCRRALLLLLWLCMAYGVFHWAVKDSTVDSPRMAALEVTLPGRLGVAPLTMASVHPNENEIFDSTDQKKLFQSSVIAAKIGAISPQQPSPAAVPDSVGPALNTSSSVEMVGASSLPSSIRGNGAAPSGNLALTLGSSTMTPRYPWIDDEPLVDKETKTVEQLILEAAETIRNIPTSPYILGQKDGPKFYKNSSCARFPTIYDIEFSNTYWQTLKTSNGTLHFYGAYYDIRAKNRLGPSLRILGMMDRIEPNVSTYCQIWFEKEKEPQFAKVLEYKYIWFSKWGNYRQGVFQPYLLACQIPKHHHGKVPKSVSVVEKPCHAANNNMRVQFDKPPKKKGFAVCVKGLDFLHEDLSVRLVEWIELLGILGADKIFFYELAVHPNITKVLRYYQTTGQVDVTPLTLPGGQPNDPRIRHIYLGKKVNHKRQNEVIPYNDCLYRNLYNYEYIALLDIDEVIMPMKADNWKELMIQVDKKSRQSKNDSRASYNFRNIYFLDDMMHGHTWFPGIPKYLHMLQHVYRSRNYTKPGQYVKCFHNPERVITLHNHFPLACLNGSCTSYPVGTDLAQLQHYRADCVRALKNCDKDYRRNSLLDTTIWKYKDALIDRAGRVLRYLGFIPSTPTSTLSSPVSDPSNYNAIRKR